MPVPRWECSGGATALWFDQERLTMKSGGATPIREERVAVLLQGLGFIARRFPRPLV